MRRLKILFFVTEDWYFCSHRLPVARAAKKAGYDVSILTRVQNHGDEILREGFHLVPLRISRQSKNPILALLTMIDVWRVYKRERPDIVHNVALKPILYGGFVAFFFGKIAVVNAIAGLGFVFSSKRWSARILRPVIKILYRIVLNRSKSTVIVQNSDDLNLLIRDLKIKNHQITLIRGSGVDIERFNVSCELPDDIVISCISRMLWDKGIGEFVDAVRRLKGLGYCFRALLVGNPDKENPAAISHDQLHKWQDEGVIEWCGYSNNVDKILAKSSLAVLPSYREGLPKSLLEAAACGKAIVTTDVPGCREIVRHNENGYLVPVKDSEALAEAMRCLIDNPKLCKKMGENGRKIVEHEFSESIVVSKTMNLYRSVIEELLPSSGVYKVRKN